MNWGIKILILYLGFVALIITLVGMSMNQKVDLVSADYYEKELKFQERIDSENNFRLLNKTISCKVQDKMVVLEFPKEFMEKDIVGTILIYRPSDSSLDIQAAIDIDPSGLQKISLNKFKRGLYQVQMEWAMEGKRYFNEQNLFMN